MFKKFVKEVTATISMNSNLNYIRERERMCNSYIKSYNDCPKSECPLKFTQNGITITCRRFESLYPEKAIAIVRRWSNAHPQKTYLTELLEKFPNTPLTDDGTPKGMCPHQLGLKDGIADCKIGYDCVECWNQIIEEDGEE